MRKFISLLILMIWLVSCTDHQKNMQEIGDYIKSATSELVQKQLDSGITKMKFHFNNQDFFISLDTNGKPIFVNESNKSLDSILLTLDNTDYWVKLNNGEIRVSR